MPERATPADRDNDYHRLLSGMDTGIHVGAESQEPPEYDGGILRMVFSSMEIPGFPSEVRIGSCRIHQSLGPVLRQRTELKQRTGLPLVFDKRMIHAEEVGAGYWLTVCEIFIDSFSGDLFEEILTARSSGYSAMGAISAMMDDRVAQELLAENLFLTLRGEPVAPVDAVDKVRHYLPYRITDREMQGMKSLERGVPTGLENPLRWYLRGAQAGPVEDGVIFMWFAIEGLAGDSRPAVIKEKLRKAGWELAHLKMEVGRLFGIRSLIVHPSSDKPLNSEDVRTAFYDAETIARVLIRTKIEVDTTWPAMPEANMFDAPFDYPVGALWHSPPDIIWHQGVLPDIQGSNVDDLSWTEILESQSLPCEVQIEGGQAQDQERLKRWAGFAATYFGRSKTLRLKIRKLDEGDGRVESDEIVVSSKIMSGHDPISEIRLGLRVLKLLGGYELVDAGVPNAGFMEGLFHGFVTGFSRQDAFVSTGNIDEGALTYAPLDAQSEPWIVGEHLGSMVAGNERSGEIMNQWLAEVQTTSEIDSAMKSLKRLGRRVDHGRELVERVSETYEALPKRKGA